MRVEINYLTVAEESFIFTWSRILKRYVVLQIDNLARFSAIVPKIRAKLIGNCGVTFTFLFFIRNFYLNEIFIA